MQMQSKKNKSVLLYCQNKKSKKKNKNEIVKACHQSWTPTNSIERARISEHKERTRLCQRERLTNAVLAFKNSTQMAMPFYYWLPCWRKRQTNKQIYYISVWAPSSQHNKNVLNMYYIYYMATMRTIVEQINRQESVASHVVTASVVLSVAANEPRRSECAEQRDVYVILICICCVCLCVCVCVCVCLCWGRRILANFCNKSTCCPQLLY